MAFPITLQGQLFALTEFEGDFFVVDLRVPFYFWRVILYNLHLYFNIPVNSAVSSQYIDQTDNKGVPLLNNLPLCRALLRNYKTIHYYTH